MRYTLFMTNREPEALDIHQMERMVAQALVDLVDDRSTRHSITVKALAARSGLPVRRVREVTDAWNLRTLSGEELFLAPGSVDRARDIVEGEAP